MARTRKSHDTDEENTKSRRGPPSFPYVVYASWQVDPNDPETMRWLVLKFQTPIGARNMIEALRKNLWGGKYELKTSPSLNWHYMKFENGMRVSLRDNKQYTEVMEIDYDPSISFVPVEVQQFKYGSGYESHRAAGVKSYDGDDKTPADARAAKKLRGRKERPDKPVKERKESVARGPKVDRSGLVSANDIATELGVEGREVRGVLRSLKLSKPAGGWVWQPGKEADDIRAQIKAGLKKAKKK